MSLQIDIHNHVTEKRAPTDASVRLLREMEQAAQAKVDKAIRLAGCPVDVVVHQVHDPLSAGWRYEVHYMLGDHRRKVQVFVQAERHATAPDAIRDALAQDIASTMLADAFRRIKL